MKDERKRRASRRVLKKLSAVRAVLSKDEREVLDAIVLGEARAHQMPETRIDTSTTESTSSTQRKDHDMLGKDNPISKSVAKSQVKAHALKSVQKGPAKSNTKGAAKAHALKSAYKGSAKSNAKGAAKAHVLKTVYKGSAKSNAKSAAKAHQMVATEPLVEQAPVTTVPPIELPKVEFDPTVEQYKPIAE